MSMAGAMFAAAHSASAAANADNLMLRMLTDLFP